MCIRDRINTLTIPEEVLRKARRLAVECHTSLSALVTQLIANLVDDDERYREARDRQLALLDHGLELGTQGATTWTRAVLHAR